MTIIITFDIETTGQYIQKDLCFAIGYCVGEIGGGSDGKKARYMETGKWLVDLGKPADQSWQQFWASKSWEKRCFDEFWSKHTDLLDRFNNDPERLPNLETMIVKLNNALRRWEHAFPGGFLVAFDTLNFDSVWLNQLLQQHHYADLARQRDGTGWRGALEVDSYRFGRLGVTPGDWNAFYATIAALPQSIERPAEADHDPAVDATNIFLDLAIAFAMK